MYPESFHFQPILGMIQNYLLIAYRNFLRFKGYALLNVTGLSIGLACSFFILLWVKSELSYDLFHRKAPLLYRITGQAGAMQAATICPALGQEALGKIPQVENMVRLLPATKVVEVNGTLFEEGNGFFADSSFFDVFTFPLQQGDPSRLLRQADEIILTQKLAQKYFGQEKALGKTILLDGKHLFRVAGILKDVPANSHLQFDYLLPLSFLVGTTPEFGQQQWGAFIYYTYIQVSPQLTDQQVPELEGRITKLFEEHMPMAKGQIQFHLQPLKAIHLHSAFAHDLAGHGNIAYVRIFSIVAVFILLLAAVNFINLSTARAVERAKEVGVRKVIGAKKGQLVGQFLGESLLFVVAAFLVAMLLLVALRTLLQGQIGIDLAVGLADKQVLLSLLGVTLLTGLLAGSYPAFYLSALGVVSTLKGANTPTGGRQLRNGLVVVQFVISTGLLIGTLVVDEQLRFIQHKQLGFDKENLLYVPMKGKLWENYQALRSQLAASSLTSHFTVVSGLPTKLENYGNAEWEGKSKEQIALFTATQVDEHFLDVFHTPLVSGSNFSDNYKVDTGKVIINQAAARVMGLSPEKAIGRTITAGTAFTIIGVVQDFHFKPLHQPIEPLLLLRNTSGGNIVVRVPAGRTEHTIAALKKIGKALNPGYPFSYGFVDQDLDKLYQTEQRMGKLFSGFTALSLLVSGLGLFGLTAYAAQQRTKEIGIRKVLGASLPAVVVLLMKDFLKLVGLAFIIGALLAMHFMNQWLTAFAYKISFHWTLFAFAGILTLLVALLTVSFQSFKAGLANPVRSLRNE